MFQINKGRISDDSRISMEDPEENNKERQKE
jgi:hypothetical protein